MSDESPLKTQLISTKRIARATTVSRVDSVQGTLDRALSTVATQLEKLSLLSDRGTLDREETQVLHAHIKGLIELSKETREREKFEASQKDLANMDPRELIKMAQELLDAENPAKPITDKP